MKYSQIVGEGFYKIKLSQKLSGLLDVYFAGASHHLFRYLEAKNETSHFAEFHLAMHKAHLRHLMELVYKNGDFTNSEDPSFRHMDEKESWNPDQFSLPDPNMFDLMLPDVRYLLGEAHLLCDRYLKNLKPPAQNKFNNSPPILKIVAVA